VKSAYAKYSHVHASSGVTGAEVAACIMTASGINDVQIIESNQCWGSLRFDEQAIGIVV